MSAVLVPSEDVRENLFLLLSQLLEASSVPWLVDGFLPGSSHHFPPMGVSVFRFPPLYQDEGTTLRTLF